MMHRLMDVFRLSECVRTNAEPAIGTPALREAGYDGTVGLEWCPVGDAYERWKRPGVPRSTCRKTERSVT